MKLKHLHYGWVMVVTAAGIMAVHSTTINIFGIFLRPLTMEFNWDRGVLSGAFSMSTLVSGLIGILGGRLSDKYGPRILVTISGLLIGIGFLLMPQINSLWQVYLIWGLFIGIGGGWVIIPVISTIPRWFAKKRGIAIGLTATGSGLGGIIWPPLAQWLISSYSWQQAFIILGSIAIIVITPLAQFLKHSPQRIGLRPYGEDRTIEDKQPLASTAGGLSFNQAIKTGRFWLFGLINFCLLLCMQVIVVHLVPHAVDIGILAMVAASILSIIMATSIIGMNLIGFISDRIGGRLALSACLTLITLSLIWLLFAREIWMFYLFAVIFGVAAGSLLPLTTIITAELFGLSSLGLIFGSVVLFGLTGAAIGPLLAGSIFDVTGGYNLALLICVIISALGVILSVILLKAKGWHGSD